jgi:MerR HTH family regulatory protein
VLRIGELSRRVGVIEHVLRAWESRYGLLKPARSAGGYRLYSEDDQSRVLLMQAHPRPRSGGRAGRACGHRAGAAWQNHQRRRRRPLQQAGVKSDHSHHVRSGHGAGMAGPCRIPKLTERVRFPSPAPRAKSVVAQANPTLSRSLVNAGPHQNRHSCHYRVPLTILASPPALTRHRAVATDTPSPAACRTCGILAGRSGYGTVNGR